MGTVAVVYYIGSKHETDAVYAAGWNKKVRTEIWMLLQKQLSPHRHDLYNLCFPPSPEQLPNVLRPTYDCTAACSKRWVSSSP